MLYNRVDLPYLEYNQFGQIDKRDKLNELCSLCRIFQWANKNRLRSAPPIWEDYNPLWTVYEEDIHFAQKQLCIFPHLRTPQRLNSKLVLIRFINIGLQRRDLTRLHISTLQFHSSGLQWIALYYPYCSIAWNTDIHCWYQTDSSTQYRTSVASRV